MADEHAYDDQDYDVVNDPFPPPFRYIYKLVDPISGKFWNGNTNKNGVKTPLSWNGVEYKSKASAEMALKKYDALRIIYGATEKRPELLLATFKVTFDLESQVKPEFTADEMRVHMWENRKEMTGPLITFIRQVRHREDWADFKYILQRPVNGIQWPAHQIGKHLISPKHSSHRFIAVTDEKDFIYLRMAMSDHQFVGYHFDTGEIIVG